MMLSSDGLHGVVPEWRIEEILNETDAPLEQKCHELIAAADAEGSPDNVTVILIQESWLR
jgi:serine/threonine protein phosphatase PrpC